MVENSTIRLEMRGAVGIVRLDRPPVNAINRAMHRELTAVVAEIDRQPDCRAVVIHGGERVFAAGADIKEMAALGPSEIGVLGRSLTDAISAVALLELPVIAAITGYALGGGLELALAADFRVVAEDASLGLPEITLGVIPGAGGTQRLPRLIGVAAAKKMIYFGEPVTGTEAVGLGLATLAVPADQVLLQALALAERLAAGPTRALAAAKQAIDVGIDHPVDDGRVLESRLFEKLFGSEDQREGMRAFVARSGPAHFTGR